MVGARVGRRNLHTTRKVWYLRTHRKNLCVYIIGWLEKTCYWSSEPTLVPSAMPIHLVGADEIGVEKGTVACSKVVVDSEGPYLELSVSYVLWGRTYKQSISWVIHSSFSKSSTFVALDLESSWVEIKLLMSFSGESHWSFSSLSDMQELGDQHQKASESWNADSRKSLRNKNLKTSICKIDMRPLGEFLPFFASNVETELKDWYKLTKAWRKEGVITRKQEAFIVVH